MLLVGLLIAVGLDLRAGSRCFANTGLRAAAYVVGSRGQGWQVSNKLPGCLPKLADTLAGVDWRYCSTSMSLMLHNCTDQALFSTGNGCKAIHDYTVKVQHATGESRQLVCTFCLRRWHSVQDTG